MPDAAFIALAAAAAVAAVALGLSAALLLRRAHRAERRLADTAAARDALMLRERDLAVNASHRLRTPITALRLGLDDLTRWPQTDPEVRIELQHALVEIDRWGAAVDDVLGGARRRRLEAAVDVDLSELTRSIVARRSGSVPGRVVQHRTRGPVPAVVDPAAVEEIVDSLIGYLLDEGTGTVRVDVSAHPTHLQIGIADDSARTLAPGVVHGDAWPPPLATAGVIAESLDGYLSVVDRAKNRFLLMLTPPA